MRQLKICLLSIIGLLIWSAAPAEIGPGFKNIQGRSQANGNDPNVNFRNDCDNAVTQIDQAINNVRARLLTGGDVWWDGNIGRYVVPKTPPGVPEVSSLYAGAVWLGGVDPAGNLKVAAQTFGRSGGRFDFYPGPLDPSSGKTDQPTCSKWDRFFVVKGASIDAHLRNFEESIRSGKPYDPEDIPKDIRGWPARGNEFFFDVHQFELPNTTQGLAGFWDQDGDGAYNPDLGDFPVIEIRGCTDKPQYPDEMIFWIYNDAGNIHEESQGDPIQMEVQVQAFAYATNDEINDMTFQRYKLINRAIESIDSTFFAMWVDPDMGCSTDDYVGSDTLRSMAYVYNQDAVDGETGCSCPGGINTYCDEIPILGVDYFRGPLDEMGKEIGMSSFTYYNRGGTTPAPDPATTDPDPANPQEYYNYISGSWKDGAPFTYGGNARGGDTQVNYAFTEGPDAVGGWSMCTQNLPPGDRRTLQASGPFRLDPGAVNELIVGVVWVPAQNYPCPSIRRLQEADDIAQALFDNCFEITDGPDAPDVDWIELDRELIAVFTNDTITSNNAYEAYAQRGLQIPVNAEDSLYRFEGYKLYQLARPDVTLADLDDPDKARLIFQVDLKNNVERVFNWSAVDNPTGSDYYVPELKVEGINEGIRHTFRITEDQFAEGARKLVNHRKYYFTALAYAHNEYEAFNPQQIIGQRRPYLEGRRNIGDGENPFYTVIPRPIVDREVKSVFGDGGVITRIDGVGTGNNFLDLSEESRLAAFEGTSGGILSYREGRGPIEVSVYDPLEVQDGEFELTFIDENMGNSELDNSVRWILRSLSDPSRPAITADRTIDVLNEQIVGEYGFTINIGQTADIGDRADETNGVIGYEEEYLGENITQWFTGIPEGFVAGGNFLDDVIFNFVANSPGESDAALDPDQALSNIGPGYFVPYVMANWRVADLPYVSPAWLNETNFQLRTNLARSRIQNVNNVDIVFTSDKSKWSRCVVVERAGRDYENLGLQTEGRKQDFDLRGAPNVTAFDINDDGLPDIDTEDPGEGMGWFPGYAIDVETGQRLNIFFGENSVYNGSVVPENFVGEPTGGDMMFNPSSQLKLNIGGGANVAQYLAGGQHFIYVTKTPYDECALFREVFQSDVSTRKLRGLREITWAGLAMSLEEMKSYKDGLIPSDLIVKLRVNNPYAVAQGSGDFNGYPTYQFRIEGKQAAELTPEGVENALDLINVVPNPYFGFSDYELSQFTTTVKITNLPAKCTVTIYSLDGKFIRQYKRDETGLVPEGVNRAIKRAQIIPDLEWDLNNAKGIPIASGVYLIHVAADGLGTRTLKWFGINRQFDPSGL